MRKKECLQFVFGLIALITFLLMALILTSMANDCVSPKMTVIRLIAPSIVLAFSLWVYSKLDAIK